MRYTIGMALVVFVFCFTMAFERDATTPFGRFLLLAAWFGGMTLAWSGCTTGKNQGEQ